MNMIKHNIKTLPSDKLMNQSLSVKIESQAKLKEWLADPLTKKNHIDCKGRAMTKGLSEFKKLYDVKEYFIVCQPQTAHYKDDSIEISYRAK